MQKQNSSVSSFFKSERMLSNQCLQKALEELNLCDPLVSTVPGSNQTAEQSRKGICELFLIGLAVIVASAWGHAASKCARGVSWYFSCLCSED